MPLHEEKTWQIRDTAVSWSLISSTVRIDHRRHWLDQVFAYLAVGAANRLAEGSPASCASAIIPMVGTSRQQPDRASPPKCSAARGAQSGSASGFVVLDAATAPAERITAAAVAPAGK
jgi:hypothetical protein